MSTRITCIRWGGSKYIHPCLLTIALIVAGGCSSKPVEFPSPVAIGVVEFVSGSPTLTRKSRQYLIGLQSRIYQGDIVETDRFSSARINLADGSRLTVGRDSRMVFNHFDLPSARLTLTDGAFRIAPAEDIARATRLELQTPVASIRARDSEFMGGFISSENTLDVGLVTGSKIEVSNLHGVVEVSTPGEGTTVIGGTAPQASRQWTPGKIERALEEIQAGL